jgi:glycosyltransferase involved in cell wall biosynthesis
MVLFVGKLEQRKGYLTLLHAASVILKQHPDVQFWFAGHGDLETARREAVRFGIESAVHLTGWAESETLANLYQRCRIFCLPSFNEGLPMSLLEAMAHGIPVVSTPVGGIPELVDDGNTGLLTEPGNALALATKILRLLDNTSYAESLGKAGQRRVQEVCSLELVSTKLREIYRNVYTRRSQ